ncbi:uncharacterized protein LOC126295235 isoform X2 [Schistocerca gregaria]|nr:uncharacterized protein LOC126295235 isoform X2 [Schistocerca gregaria]
MAGVGSPPAVYNARLRRVVFSSREQHESDLRWVIFSRKNHNLSNGPARAKCDRKENSPAVAPEHGPAAGCGSFYVGMDSRDSKRAIAHQRYVDAALRSVIDLPCLQQY